MLKNRHEVTYIIFWRVAFRLLKFQKVLIMEIQKTHLFKLYPCLKKKLCVRLKAEK